MKRDTKTALSILTALLMLCMLTVPVFAIDDTDGVEGDAVDINVLAKVVEEEQAYNVYCVDIEWGYMKFEFKAGTQWEPSQHKDVGANEGIWTSSYLDGVNNRVIVNNHSSYFVCADFSYTMESAAFNDSAGSNAVVGKFYDGNTAAAANARSVPDNNTSTIKSAYDNVDVVYFAFSGTPDANRATTLTDFTKVGKITVTISPQ